VSKRGFAPMGESLMAVQAGISALFLLERLRDPSSSSPS
jgi:hypothetical protein